MNIDYLKITNLKIFRLSGSNKMEPRRDVFVRAKMLQFEVCLKAFWHFYIAILQNCVM